MLWRRRPKVGKFARKGDAKRLVRALGYRDELNDSYGRLYDLGAGVRRDAALALASVADTGEVDIGAALIGALGDTSGEVRRAAASALGARRDGRAAATLAEAAMTWREPRYEAARITAIDALTDLSGPESAEDLVGILIVHPAGPDRGRELVRRMLDHGGEETAHSACTTAEAALLTEGNGASAGRAIEVLSWLGPIAVEPLVTALDGSPATTRIQVIHALGRLRDLRASPALVRQLSDGDFEARAAAAEALGQIADPASARALAAATTDPSHVVRVAALTAIGALGPLAMPREPIHGSGVPVHLDQSPERHGGQGEQEPAWLRASRA